MSRLQRVAYTVLAAALFIALLAYCVRGSYARYILDDFCTAATLNDRGFVGAMQEHRATWSGRYSYFAFKAALEAIGPVTARFTPALMAVLLVCASWWSLRRWTFPRLPAFVAALTIAFAVLDGSPSLLAADGVSFWETGYLTYVMPLVLFILWAGLLRSPAAAAVLMLIAGGFSETSLAAQGALTCGTLIAMLVLRRRREAWAAGGSVVATLVALAIVASAPGNAVRHAQLGPSRSLVDGVGRALGWAYGFFGSYVFLGSAALLVVIAVGLALGSAMRPQHTAVAALIAFGLYLVAFFPIAWLLPTGSPPAALDVANFFLVATCFCSAMSVGSVTKRSVALLVIAVAIVPLWSAAAHLRRLPEAQARAAQLETLDAQLRAEHGRDVALRDWRLREMRVLTEDPSYWSNRCLSRYYGLRSVRLDR